MARIAVALLGTLLVWVAFRFGAEYRWEVGILAAVLFAFYPSYVEHSHFVTPDIPLTLFLLLVMLSSLRYLKLGSMRYLIFAAVFAALATGVKYPGMGSVLLIAAVVIARQWRRWRPLFVGLYVSGCVYVASLFLSSPYLVLRFKKVLAAVQHEAKGSHLGAEGLDWLGNAVYYAQSYLGAAGVLLLVFGIIGAVAIVGRERMLALPAFFGLFYWVVLSRHALHWERWALPMYSSGLILGAYGMVFLYEKARQRPTARRLATAAVVAMITVSLASVTLSGVVKTLSATLPETRLVSLRFLEAHSITKENAIYDGATPLSPLSGPSCARELEKLDPRISYIVVSEYMYGRYFKAPTGYEMQKAFYQKVLALPLLAEFRAAPARHRLDVLDVDDVTLQNSTSFELADISEGVSYIVRYLRHRDEMLVGPTIRIHAAPIRPAPQAARE